MRTLGMIGGTSWHSTVVYYRLLNEYIGKVIGTHGNPPLILHSLNIELMRRQDWDEINSKYLEVSQNLQQAGAEAIILCANTPHKVYDHVQPQIDIPILHIAEAIGREAQKQGMKTLGLLGTKPTMTAGFISDYLGEKFGIQTVIPDEEYIDQAHYYIAQELTRGQFTDASKSFFLDRMADLKEKGAEGMILGCTELPMYISSEDFDLPLLATTELHAQLACDFILGKE